MGRIDKRRNKFWQQQCGASTVAFVVLILPVLALVFFAIEVAGAYFFSLSLEHAAQRAARTAVVRQPVAVGVPLRNQKTAAGVFGTDCRLAASPCVTPDPSRWSCSGAAGVGAGGCNETALATVLAEASRNTPLVKREFVSIHYDHTGLGYAGGPYVPRVIVEIKNPNRADGMIPSPLAFTSLLRFFFEEDALMLVPASAGITGEDLRTSY